MGQHQKYVKDLEAQGRHGKEIDRDQLLQVIVQEGTPSLRGRLAATHHVFADAGLTNVNVEFEQFTVDAGCAPSWVVSAHLADQVVDFVGNRGSSGLASTDLPRPDKTKALPMPSDDRLGLNDSQS